MQPSLWQPPVELSMHEEQIVTRIRKAKLFVFLRFHRHELFDETFQQELAALDSSPLWGAGRVEDTYNLIGHALKKILSMVAEQQGRDLVKVGHEAEADVICGTSLKATLDRDGISQRSEKKR